ncbi:MAG: hypothetical protein CSA66_03165 [Proteobacteria bacterium]|nr:MAG: hypothetical protein CSA66_03165 [Pseudomonadota bacterium]
MRRKLRIGYGRIFHESNCFAPGATGVEAFEHHGVLTGAALARAAGLRGAEIPGMVRAAELTGFRVAAARARAVEPVPLLSAWAMPSAPLAAETLDALDARLTRARREAGPLDGLYLALHGAMRAIGDHPEGEERLLATARRILGDDVPIAASFDLHGLLTPAKVAPVTILGAYHTNPHRDMARVGYRMGRLLTRTLRGAVRPTSAWRSLPMVLGGGAGMDFLPPLRRVFARMRRLERDRRVLYTSLFTCHPFNDSPDLGWSVHVVTDGAPALAEGLADELADLAWETRHRQPPRFLEPGDAIARVRRARILRKTGAAVLSDASDAVGAGAPGDRTGLLRALLEGAPDLTSLVPVRAPEVIAAHWDTPIGAAVQATVGAPPLPVAGRLVARADLGEPGRAVALDLGHVRLVVTEGPPYTLKPSFYTRLGLDVWRADIIVVKSFFHFLVYYWPIVRLAYPVQTTGSTDLARVTTLTFNDAVHPKQQVADWREADRRRRLAGDEAAAS